MMTETLFGTSEKGIINMEEYYVIAKNDYVSCVYDWNHDRFIFLDTDDEFINDIYLETFEENKHIEEFVSDVKKDINEMDIGSKECIEEFIRNYLYYNVKAIYKTKEYYCINKWFWMYFAYGCAYGYEDGFKQWVESNDVDVDFTNRIGNYLLALC